MGFLYLVLLGAIWGGSFLFMRIAVSSFGPAYLIELRVLFAALTLSIIALIMRRSFKRQGLTKHYLLLGMFNSALPFLLFAYAAQTVSASVLSVLNSTAPFWGVLIAAVWLKQPISGRTLLGCLSGLIGVGALVNIQTLPPLSEILPILAGLAATLSYGIASNYTKIAPKVGAFDNALGNLWASTFIIIPVLFVQPMPASPDMSVWGAVIALGVVCTGIAYILYFKLIDLMGAAQALTVTFLIPLFGILWGHLFLNEPIGPNTLLGAVCVLVGVMLVTGVRVQQFLPWRQRLS